LDRRQRAARSRGGLRVPIRGRVRRHRESIGEQITRLNP
jgi:hypothetical protein